MPITIIAAKAPIEEKPTNRFIDVGVNLTDPVFKGFYHGKRKHDDDFDTILCRSQEAGVKSMIITGTSLRESQEALSLSKKYGLFATVGCHPTRSLEFERYPGGPGAYLDAMDKLVASNRAGHGRVVAIGECGLDYDRTHFAMPDVQKRYFRLQLGLAKKHHLPLFLHSRAAHSDFVRILRSEGYGQDGGIAVGGNGGVVHSFTGTVAEVNELMDMGFYISVNGCSLKTSENLEAVKAIRPDRIMFETDAPWCTMTSTHASKQHLETMPASHRQVYLPPAMKPENFVQGKPVRGRNEPSAVGGVAWVVHRLQSPPVPFGKVTEKAWNNTVALFGLGADLEL